jgi:hypothetical protein
MEWFDGVLYAVVAIVIVLILSVFFMLSVVIWFFQKWVFHYFISRELR